MRVAVVAEPGGGGLLQALAEDGSPDGPPRRVADLAAAVRERERAQAPRWVWTAAEDVYPPLLGEGVPVARCHDLALTEGLLLAYEGRWSEPRSFGAAWARLRGLPVPAEPRSGPRDRQPVLFEPDRAGLPEGSDLLAATVAVHQAQQRRLRATEHPDRLRLLVAAESAGGLAAAEMRAAGTDGDLYATLAAEAFGGDRARAKLALLSAMYGGGQGPAGDGALLAVLRRRFPDAIDYVEAAARAGEQGRVVRSRLGRTCPPPSASWRELTGRTGEPGLDEGGALQARRALRDRGRFTRNFVIQASAADWALVLLAGLRGRLAATGAQLVFFQHDEVVVHCPGHLAGTAVAAAVAAGEQARRLVFGDTPVRLPLNTSVVDCYADAK